MIVLLFWLCGRAKDGVGYFGEPASACLPTYLWVRIRTAEHCGLLKACMLSAWRAVFVASELTGFLSSPSRSHHLLPHIARWGQQDEGTQQPPALALTSEW
ncbi:hypothetical protein HRR83_002038 [Exophiala dermatitidis]|nr:hypothetical protein HRR73_005339 [Exophiala dermatitidis]KAJ4523920.1 hypothetical protein HRR74_002115 [Exophiala dermatitidis]KAJ4537138.1 hypothetical protein HRR76_005153 [Exophiala dermatitidis]KAJ4555264.1 hypothetical protein HRR77_001202 [Exophiala dermatitidis]KAJ4578856.1 hypothetical protein HRR81_003006 [Exophiala dermatitidis]